MPSPRHLLVVLVLAVLAVAPFASSLAAAAGADCAVVRAPSPDEGCCGGDPSSTACAAACATLCGPAMSAAVLSPAGQFGFLPAAARSSRPVAPQARAPDTAPPKVALA
jgi:hypothetical protein